MARWNGNRLVIDLAIRIRAEWAGAVFGCFFHLRRSSTCRLENKRSVSSSRIASTKSNRTCVGLHSLRRNPGSRLSGLRLHAWMGRTFKLGNQSAVCLAFLPWVKREGVIFWLIAAIYGAFVIWRSKRSPKYLCALLPGLCIVLAWRIYLIQMHAVSSSDFMEVNLVNLRANIHRFGPILSGFAYEFTDLRAWGLFWLVAGLAGVYFVRRHGGANAI